MRYSRGQRGNSTEFTEKRGSRTYGLAHEPDPKPVSGWSRGHNRPKTKKAGEQSPAVKAWLSTRFTLQESVDVSQMNFCKDPHAFSGGVYPKLPLRSQSCHDYDSRRVQVDCLTVIAL